MIYFLSSNIKRRGEIWRRAFRILFTFDYCVRWSDRMTNFSASKFLNFPSLLCVVFFSLDLIDRRKCAIMMQSSLQVID